MVKIAYRLLLIIAWPLLLLYTIAAGIRHRSLRYILQRFALRLPTLYQQPLWIHCVSVGELNTALLLVDRWLNKYPDDYILITTSTISSARVYKAKARARSKHCYLPLDYAWMVKRFLTQLQPRGALIVETEVWYNLFRGCGQYRIPTAMINARLAKRVVQTSAWLRGYYQQSLKVPKAIYTKSARDRDNYLKVGAPAWKTKTVGNLKYAVQFDEHLPRLIKPPYILAASTHADEELQVARAWQQIDRGNFVLVIAPRHPKRARKILHKLSAERIQANYYHPNTTAEDGAIILYNHIGQLPQLIKHASLVFLGGSLVDKGGHNLLEAAVLGTPQCTGSYLSNVAEEAQALNAAGGLIIVQHARDLASLFAQVIKQPNCYQKNAIAAQDYLRQHADIAERYITELEALHMQP